MPGIIENNTVIM